MIHGLARSFGRPPPPATLGAVEDELVAAVEGILDDFQTNLEGRLDDWLASNTRYYSGIAFESFKERWEGEKDEMIEGLRAPVQKVIGEILADSETQARLGEAKKTFEKSLIKVAVISVLGGVATTWALFRWLPPR